MSPLNCLIHKWSSIFELIGSIANSKWQTHVAFWMNQLLFFLNKTVKWLSDWLKSNSFDWDHSNPPWREHNWLLKGMEDETLIALLHAMPKTHPLLIKRIGTTLHSMVPLFVSKWLQSGSVN